jgi:hypothetical protein
LVDSVPDLIDSLSAQASLNNYQILFFINALAAQRDFGENFSSFGSELAEFLDEFIPLLDKGLKLPDFIPFFQFYISVKEGVSNKKLKELIKGALSQASGDNFPKLLYGLIPKVEELKDRLLTEKYSLCLFGYALAIRNIELARQAISQLEKLKADDPTTKLILQHFNPYAFTPVFLNSRRLLYAAKTKNAAILGTKGQGMMPIIISGDIKLSDKVIRILNFNKMGINAVFYDFNAIPDGVSTMSEALALLPPAFLKGRWARLLFIFKYIDWADKDGYYEDEKVTIDTAKGLFNSLFIHEVGHHWDDTLSPASLSELYCRISWWGTKSGSWVLKSKHEGDFARDWGMKNRLEDLPSTMECYVDSPENLRENIREEIKKGNYRLALKYLFVKHLTPFKGREYELSDSSPAFTTEELERGIGASKDQAANTEALSFLSKIKKLKGKG